MEFRVLVRAGRDMVKVRLEVVVRRGRVVRVRVRSMQGVGGGWRKMGRAEIEEGAMSSSLRARSVIDFGQRLFPADEGFSVEKKMLGRRRGMKSMLVRYSEVVAFQRSFESRRIREDDAIFSSTRDVELRKLLHESEGRARIGGTIRRLNNIVSFFVRARDSSDKSYSSMKKQPQISTPLSESLFFWDQGRRRSWELE